MKTRLTATLLAAAAAAFFAIGVGGAKSAPPAPFLGTWWAIDHFDGSLQRDTFGTAGTLTYLDKSAGACGGTVAVGIGSGSINGDTWTGTMTGFCPQTGQQFPGISITFTFDPATDTLTSDVGDTWTRAIP